VALADEPYLILGMEFCIFMLFYIAGVVGAATRLPRTVMPPLEVPRPSAAGDSVGPGTPLPVADEGLTALIGNGARGEGTGRAPGMMRLLGLALCLAALGLGLLPASGRLVVQARIASLLGRHERALAWTGEALAKNPQDASAHHLRGLLLLAKGQDTDKTGGLEHLRKAVQAGPRSARFHVSLGVELNGFGLATEAAQAASEAVKLHPGEYRLWMLLADVLTAQGKRSDAVDAYRKAVELEPQDPVLLNNLAFTLLELDRETGLALELAKKSVELQPGYVFNLDTLAWAFHKNGRSNEALEIMLQIRESVATLSAEIEFHNAVICREMNMLDTPRAVFERIAARPDAKTIPGLTTQIEAVLATLPAQAEAVGSETSSTASAGTEGR
nr:tetratricopeptide repeat protein [Candidatus Ozemobacteraceae bacterium]